MACARFSWGIVSDSKARPMTHLSAVRCEANSSVTGKPYTTAAEAPCNTLPAMKIPVELPTWRSTVDPSRANNPTRSGDRREAPLSASQPQIGEKARSAAPYMAIKTETQYCTRSCSTWLRLCKANGITGTITPYKNISYET